MIDGEFQVSMEIKDGVAVFASGAIGKGNGRQKTENYEQAKALFEKHPDLSFRQLADLSGIPPSSLQRYKKEWSEEQARAGESEDLTERGPNSKQELSKESKEDRKDQSKPFRSTGTQDQLKKPPARELGPFERAPAEAVEIDRKRA